MQAINVDLDYFTHPKTLRLVGLLGPGSEVYPIKLWCWCAKYHAETGLLTGYSAEEIESCIGWMGDRGKLIDALVRVEFIEQSEMGFYVHDFVETNGHIAAFKERAKAAAQARWARLPHKNAPSNASDVSEHAPSNAPSNATEPVKQSPNQLTNQLTKPTTAEAPPEPPVGEYGDLEQHLLASWGREGRIGYAMLTQLVGLGKKHGKTKLFDAITEAGKHNVRNIAYVTGILEPKRKADPVIDSLVRRLKKCEKCGAEIPKGDVLCPVCYPKESGDLPPEVHQMVSHLASGMTP